MTMTAILQRKKVLYIAKAHTTGGRDGGASRTDDGRLDVKLSIPGKPGAGTNPEQLFAAGWSACFESAIMIAAAKKKISLPDGVFIDAEVDLCMTDGEYSIEGRLKVALPNVEREVAQALLDIADHLCPYSNAIRGNVPVQIALV
jgi:osmotically inducible protein OsmC